MYRFAFVTVFNQRLFVDTNQVFLYDYVENGTRTLDRQISRGPLFHRDNGDGVQGGVNDTSSRFKRVTRQTERLLVRLNNTRSELADPES